MPKRASVLSKLTRDLDVPEAEHAVFAACVARALPPGGERHRLTPWLRGRVAVEAVREPSLSTATQRRLVDEALARARPLEAGGIPHGLLTLAAWLAGQDALDLDALARLTKLAEVAGGLFEDITLAELHTLSDWLIARPESALVDLRWLHEYPYVINAWTTAIFAFEPIFAVLIWNRTARPLLIGLSAIIWTGTALITGLVPFCLAMFVAGLAFVPAESWHRLLTRWGCGACSGVADGAAATSAA